MASFLDVSSALRFPGQSYAFEAELPPSQYDISGDTVAFGAAVCRGEYLSGGGDVSLKGTVEATARANCDRCLKEFEFPVRAVIDAKFAAEDGGDPDIYPLDGHRISLDDPAKDALLLELPIRFLCSETCLGLCPRCGHDLNLGPCACQEGEA